MSAVPPSLKATAGLLIAFLIISSELSPSLNSSYAKF